MMKVKRAKLSADEDPARGLSFWCPACQEAHVIRVGVEGSWKWDGNTEAPTIDPSVKCEHYKMSAEGEAMIVVRTEVFDETQPVPPTDQRRNDAGPRV
jgi:hypothetical protein